MFLVKSQFSFTLAEPNDVEKCSELLAETSVKESFNDNLLSLDDSAKLQDKKVVEVNEITDNNHQSVLPILRQNEDFNDIWFDVKGEKIGANKFVLAAYREYFYALIFGSFKESKETVIEMKSEHITPSVFKMILDFCYTGRTNFGKEVEVSTIENLLRTAHLYQLTSVVDSVTEVINKVIDSDNCFCWLEIASELNLSNLLKHCLNAILSWAKATKVAEENVRKQKVVRNSSETFEPRKAKKAVIFGSQPTQSIYDRILYFRFVKHV